MVNFAIPFTSNVTISISISQLFSSYVAFYLAVYAICQNLLLSWIFYSEGNATFQLVSWVSRKDYISGTFESVSLEILVLGCEPLSRTLHNIAEHDLMQWHPPLIALTCDLVTEYQSTIKCQSPKWQSKIVNILIGSVANPKLNVGQNIPVNRIYFPFWCHIVKFHHHPFQFRIFKMLKYHVDEIVGVVE